MRTAESLRAAAKRAGLTVLEVERVPTADGRTAIASLMEFDDPWAAARLLVELSKEDATDPIVREWALSIQKACQEKLGEQGPTRSPELVACTAAAIQENVQRQILFIHERKETFQSARETIALGAGDCDDHARLVLALLLAANIPASDLVFFEEDGQPVHVVAVALSEWVETTIAADFGEHPYDALARLEVETGESPMAHAPIEGMGTFLGDPTVAELKDFVAAQSYQRDVFLNMRGCAAWAAADPSGYGAWAADLYDAVESLNKALKYAQLSIDLTPDAIADITTARPQWEAVAEAAKPFVPLLTRLEQAGYCPSPDFGAMPQPKSKDVDLTPYLWADQAKKQLEHTAETTWQDYIKPAALILAGAAALHAAVSLKSLTR